MCRHWNRISSPNNHTHRKICAWMWWRLSFEMLLLQLLLMALVLVKGRVRGVVVVVSKMVRRRMEVSLVIRFNLRFTMKLTQTPSTVHIEVDLKHRMASTASVSRIPKTVKTNTILNICIRTLTAYTHTPFIMKWNMNFFFLSFRFVLKFTWFYGCCISLYVKRRPLVNGNAFDHVLLHPLL